MGSMDTKDMAELRMLALEVLEVPNDDYICQLCEKLSDEGISGLRDLLAISEMALETKLCSHSPLTIREVADTKKLRCAAVSRSRSPSPSRSRSPILSARGKKRSRSRSPSPSRKVRKRGKNSRRRIRTKPELWRAVENGNLAHVRMLLDDNVDVEEKFDGWSPLMKAAEEGHVQIIRELLNKRADMNMTNKNGES